MSVVSDKTVIFVESGIITITRPQGDQVRERPAKMREIIAALQAACEEAEAWERDKCG